MIVCFTNHALDQFLEDLMAIGIPASCIVRLGSKSTTSTEDLLLRKQTSSWKVPRNAWRELNDMNWQMQSNARKLAGAMSQLTSPVQNRAILDFLEFAEQSYPFFDAFEVVQDGEEMQVVGHKGRKIRPDYLLDRWIRGCSDRGAVQTTMEPEVAAVWSIPKEERSNLLAKWLRLVQKDILLEIRRAGRDINKGVQKAVDIFREKDKAILYGKRIIACTTTGAANNSEILKQVSPKVLLVEEAGEVLESHIITSLTPLTERLIMIGDHKQLRPKVNNYDLTVEKGDGYDLNRSLFERLVVEGFPHTTLTQQHRMRPEISELVRHLTYPMLEDAPSTLNRPNIRGLQSNVIFVDHNEPETFVKGMFERTTGSSKQNQFEADLVLKYVKYLAQQGYASDDIIVLTPYLGQLRMLQDTLRKENDPVLNDMDRHDLFQAGLLNANDMASTKRTVQLSSIGR